jgi:hypothetical protein
MHEEGIVPGGPPDLAGILDATCGHYPWRESGHHDSSWPAALDGNEGQTTRRPRYCAASLKALRAAAAPQQHHGISRPDA